MVPKVLLPAVPLHSGRVLLPITPPVVGIARTPFPDTVDARLAVFRVGGDLSAVIIDATAPLTANFAANRLAWLIPRWLEDSSTVAAAPFDHTGVCRTADSARVRGAELLRD